IKQGYKQTEIGIIPEDWESYSICDVTKQIFLGLTSKVDYVEYNGVPLIRASDISEGYLNFENVRIISYTQHKALTKLRRAKKNYVLVSKSGSLGICALVDVEIEFSIYESIIAIEPNSLLKSSFLLSLLRHDAVQNRMTGDKVGSSVGHLNIEAFRKLKLPIPPLKEQTAIATALSDIDALIGELDKLIAKKQGIKQATMQQLLTGKKRLAGFSGEWEVKRLGEVATFFSGGTPLTSISEYYNGNIPWITSGDLNTDYIYEVTGRISKLGLENSSAKMVKKETLLIALYGATAGVTAISKINAAINQAVLAIIPNNASVEFLYFKLSYLKNWLILTYTQGGQPNLSADIVKSIEISIPTKEEQTAIANILSDMDAEISQLERRHAKMGELKQGMMQELLTGRIRLTGVSY
ncbi:MAG: restriction endonuclease subunit S, partial [Methylococcales bacterium]|nr:restriction endonuclease subunit S [Methylococcales bacterium]